MLEPCLDALDIKPESIYVDVTFGGGGHSRAILERLTTGKLYGFDQDEDAKQNIPENENFVFVDSNFQHLRRFMKLYRQVGKVSGILADLGVSSYQFDTAERGFSFRFDGPLDMRMNQATELTAATILNTYSETELIRLLSDFGEVRNSKSLARAIVERRENQTFSEIQHLNNLLDKMRIGAVPKYFSTVYQALRIEVNDEMKALEDFLKDSLEVLEPGGKLVVMSYHSIEDRLVKRFMKTGNVKGEMIRDEKGVIHRPFKLITKKPIEADANEIKINSRARSAKLRIAEKK